MDYRKYEGLPIYKKQGVVGSVLLGGRDEIKQLYVYLRKHAFDTEDGWMHLGAKTTKGMFY